MSIAVDQTRLRKVVDTLLPTRSLERDPALTALQFVRLAAGADHEDQPEEHIIVQCISQTVSALSGLELGEMQPVEPIDGLEQRRRALRALAARLPARAVRELTYAFIFLVLVADLQLTAEERTALEEFQEALGIDDERATDLVVFLTETVADSAA